MNQHKKDSLSRTFARSLRAARGERSQAEFARYLGIKHQQTYQRYENGLIPGGDTLHEIALRIGVTIDALLSGAQPKELDQMPPAGRFDSYDIYTLGSVEVIRVFCRRMTADQLYLVSEDVLKDETLTDSSRCFWVKILMPELLKAIKDELGIPKSEQAKDTSKEQSS